MNLSKFKNVKLKDWVLEKNADRKCGYVGYMFTNYKNVLFKSKTVAGLWKKIEGYLNSL